MNERILFLTGRLAQNRLEKVLQGMEPTAFGWSVLSVGVKVAALMTEPILMRRLPRPIDLENRERLGRFAGVTTVDSIVELQEAIAQRRSKVAA